MSFGKYIHCTALKPYTINAMHDGKVWWNTDGYTMALLHSDWLYKWQNILLP